jgi:hypothetical protein
MRTLLLSAATELKSKPLLGIVSSVISAMLDYTQTIQLIAMVLGLLIAIVTLILKVLELVEKIKKKSRN